MILSDTQKIILLGTFCTNSKCEKSCFFLISLKTGSISDMCIIINRYHNKYAII